MTETTTEHAAPRMQRRDQTSTVTVACNWPNGIRLQLYIIEEITVPGPGGQGLVRSNESTIDYEAGYHDLNGPALDLAQIAGGNLPDYRIVKGKKPGTGYGLTTVPRVFWERWLEQNKNSPFVKNHIVFAASSEARAADEAKEKAELSSGIQPLSQSGDTRVPSGRQVRKYDANDNDTRVSPNQARELAAAEAE